MDTTFFWVCIEINIFSSPYLKYTYTKPDQDAELKIFLKDLPTHGINKVDSREAVNDCF